MLLLDVRSPSMVRSLLAPPRVSLTTVRREGSLAPSFYYIPGPYSAVSPSVVTLGKLGSSTSTSSNNSKNNCINSTKCSSPTYCNSTSTDTLATCSTENTGNEIDLTPASSYRAAFASAPPPVTPPAVAHPATVAAPVAPAPGSWMPQQHKLAVCGEAVHLLLLQQQQTIAAQRGISLSSRAIQSIQSPSRGQHLGLCADGVVHHW